MVLRCDKRWKGGFGDADAAIVRCSASTKRSVRVASPWPGLAQALQRIKLDTNSSSGTRPHSATGMPSHRPPADASCSSNPAFVVAILQINDDLAAWLVSSYRPG